MRYLICYDIAEEKIRRRVAKYLESLAWRIQYSVFTCDSDEQKMHCVKRELIHLIKEANQPQLLIAPLCSTCIGKLWHIGTGLEPEQSAIII